MNYTKRFAFTLLVTGVAACLTAVGALATTPATTSLASGSALLSAEIATANEDTAQLAPLDEQGRRLYIVRLNEPSLAAYEGGIAGLAATSPRATGAARLDINAPASRAYLDHLSARHADLLDSVSGQIGRAVEPAYTYLNVLNAMAVGLTPDEARRVQSLNGVRSVEADRIREVETDAGPDLIGAPAVWDGDTLPGLQTRGEGVVVGIIDTGVNSQHPSFAATDMDGYTHTNPYGSDNFVGWCDENPAFCNDKLIGAWTFHPNGGSPEDTHGHGSHVGSTAAGNRHEAAFEIGAQVFDIELSGVAPRANVIAYKVCDPSCPNTSSIAAVNQGIDDGVDVLNYSISGTDNPWLDAVDQAFLDAFAANVYVAASAGNDGPGPSTVAKTGPWNAAVAASTHSRVFANAVHLAGGPQDLAGTPGSGPALTSNFIGDLRWAGDVDAANSEGCSAFPAGSFDGEAALIARGTCAFADKVNNAVAAGADFVVTYNNAGGPPIVMGGLESTSVPAVMVDDQAGADLIAALAGGSAEVEVEAAVDMFEQESYADVMGGFSSRGPSQFDLLAPTFSAPGVSILAAGPSAAGDPNQWYTTQGTSMSSPHAAGAAALVRGLYPDFTPAEMRSMMALSANPDVLIKEDGLTPADPFDQGSGRLDLEAAGRQMLVMDESVANFEAADPAIGGDPRTLNVPNLVDQTCQGGCSWTRTVTSVADDPITYEASANAPAGMTVTVDPASFTIAPGDSQTLEITVDVDLEVLSSGDWAFAELVLEAQDITATGGLPSSLSGSKVVFDPAAGGDPSYDPGTSQTFCFDAESSTDDWEYAETVWMRFPSDWEVTDVSVQGTPSCENSGTFGTFDWSFVNDPFELRIDHERVHENPIDTCNAHYCVDITTAAGADPAEVSWYWLGDEFGDAPNYPCSSDGYTPDGEAACDESVNPPAAVPLVGSEPVLAVAPARMPIVIVPLSDAPEIAVDPESMVAELAPDTMTTQTLEISNNGDADLEWAIEEAPRSVQLDLADSQAAPSGVGAPFELALDDGDGNNAVGVGGVQFVWFNRFTPDSIDFPITLDRIEVMFGYPGSTGGINEGELVDIYLYEDADGDPTNGADHLASLHDQEVQSIDGTTWSVYNLAQPVTFEGPGDILIAVVNRTAGTSPSTFPAVIDQTSPSQGRSWIGFGEVPSDPPDLTEFPTLGVIDGLGIAGNYLVRGFGTTDGACYNPDDVSWLSIAPTSGITPANSSSSVEVTYDSTGLAEGLYEAVLCINSNDADQPVVGVLVSLEVGAPAAIEVTPGEVEGTVSVDGSVERALAIANTGEGELNWTIDTAQVPTGTVSYGVHQPELAQSVVSPQGGDRAANVTATGASQPFPSAAVLGGAIEAFDEGFEDITILPGAGWSLQNQSDPLGTSDWFQGNPNTFQAHQGPEDSYIGANFNNTSGVGTISNWLLTPELVLQNGTELRFWTRRTDSAWEDRLEVRLSTSGDSTEVGSSATDVGDFDVLLVSINENLEPGGYPQAWTEFVVEVEGLPEATTGRFALRYYVTNGGPSGNNSDFIGIDTLSVTQPEEGCASPESISWLSVNPDAGTTAADAVSSVGVTLDADGLGEGTYEALLCVNSNDPANPLVEVPVTMTVVDQDPAELSVDPLLLAFGNVAEGDSTQLGFTIGNVADAGALSLELSGLDLAGDAEFAVTGGDCTLGSELAPGESCTVEVTFSPSDVDVYGGQIDVATADGQTASVALEGSGVDEPAQLSVDVSELDFGEVGLQQTAVHSVVVSNTADAGAASLTLGALEITGDTGFSVAGGDCAVGAVLEAGESCSIDVEFAPVTEGDFGGTLSVDSNDGQSAAVLLSGEGVVLTDELFHDRFEVLE